MCFKFLFTAAYILLEAPMQGQEQPADIMLVGCDNVNAALKRHSRRVLLIIGVAHIGSLKSIFRDVPDFRIVDPLNYLNP